MTPAHIVVCESSTEAKFSRHVVIDGYYVSGVSDARMYAEKVRERAAGACTRLVSEQAWAGFVDMSVYKNGSAFRVFLSAKPSKNNHKRVVSGHTNAQSLIRYLNGCTALPSVTTVKISGEIADDTYLRCLVDELPRLYRDLENFRYRCHDGNVLSWDRIRPSYCTFCRREHTNDNFNFAIDVTRSILGIMRAPRGL